MTTEEMWASRFGKEAYEAAQKPGETVACVLLHSCIIANGHCADR